MQKATKKEPPPPVGRWGAREAGIMEVAGRLFIRHGYESVTMATVATACGLSEGTLYNYFRDKSDLAVRVTLAAFERHASEAEDIVVHSTSLRRGLEQLIALELRILIEAKGMLRIWLREVRGAQGYPQSPSRHVLRQFSGHLIGLFQKWGAVPATATGLDLTLVRDIVFGSAEHIVWTAIVQNRVERLDVDRLSRDLALAYLRAFGVHGRARAPIAAAAVPRKGRTGRPRLAAKRKRK